MCRVNASSGFRRRKVVLFCPIVESKMLHRSSLGGMSYDVMGACILRLMLSRWVRDMIRIFSTREVV